MSRGTDRGRGQAAWAVVIAGTLLSAVSGAVGAAAAASDGGTTQTARQMSAPTTDYNPGADAQDMAKVVYDSFCAEDPDNILHTPEWYAAVDSWQAILPYKFSKPTSPSAEARYLLFGEPRLTDETRKDTCDSMTSFAKTLKAVTLNYKRDLYDGCTTAAGLSAFYDYKLKVFRAIDDHNWPKVTNLMPGWRDPARFGARPLNCTEVTSTVDTAD